MMLTGIIERLYAEIERPGGRIDENDARDVIGQLLDLLDRGEVRAASPVKGDRPGGPDRPDKIEWQVNAWVKKGILLAFKCGEVKGIPDAGGTAKSAAAGGLPGTTDGKFHFLDKDTLPRRGFTPAEGVRVVPGGTSVRRGAFVGRNTVIMPPAFVNIGAYVGEGSMVDSNALVGSCAQIGARVHLSAGTQIGGVLEPVGATPVIVEDNVFVGGNCGIYEGTLVRAGAVIGSGVTLTGSTPVYDLPRATIHGRSGSGPLEIPPGAVVIAGNRHISHPFAKEHHLSLYTPVIVKYRDEKTGAATALEEALR